MRMELSLANLRVLREVAERGSFTAAAVELGYTQSAVSRQAAALERAAGVPLFDRRPDGVRLTPAGQTMLRHAVVALDAVATAERELAGLPSEGGAVRMGMFPSAGALIVPRALAVLRRTHPDINVTTREGTTPALVRALRARTLDLALLSAKAPYRPPDDETPRLAVATLAETTLLLAVPASSPLTDTVTVAELPDQTWIASPSSTSEPLLGVWPGLPGRPRVSHTARDWLTKLHLVAAGCGVTTVSASFAAALPAGVRLVEVRGGPPEQRRLILARLPGPQSHTVARLIRVLRQEAAHLPV
jgi:DNA-binding transcriptional LysR family regulator